MDAVRFILILAIGQQFARIIAAAFESMKLDTYVVYFRKVRPDMIAVAIIIAILTKVVYPRPNIVKITDPIAAKGLLSAAHHGSFTRLEARALPNQRLVKTFGISNAFTTTDPKHHGAFVRTARNLISLNETQWTLLTGDIKSIVCVHLRHKNSIKPVPFVQGVVLHTVCRLLFKAPQPEASETELHLLAAIAEDINEAWLASKSTTGIDAVTTSIHDHLRKLLPGLADWRSSRESNPLNLLLPAYETLWRVVLRCFLEVRYRADTHRYRMILCGFLSKPTIAQFTNTRGPGYVLPAAHLVLETLRLYPPTKRIYRATSASSREAVDVEAIHRSHEFWGKDSNEFRPARWMGIRKAEVEEKGYFMPFGSGPLKCPAAREFGPMIVGLLVGAMMESFADGWEMRKGEAKEDVRCKGPLGNERTDFKDLVLDWVK